MTTATRFLPLSALVAPQTASNVGWTRGARVSVSLASAKRHPSTAPFAGVSWSGPLGANFHDDPLSWKYPQKR